MMPNLGTHDPKLVPIFVRPLHSDRRSDFHKVASSTQEIKEGAARVTLLCTECFKSELDIGVPLRRCGKCKSVRYCSRECQKRDWPKHKSTCGPEVVGTGILKLAERFLANKLLLFQLQVCLVLDFDLLRNRSTNVPLMTRIEIGIEPADIIVFMQLLYGAEMNGDDVVGMFQINTIYSDKSRQPLASMGMEMWRDKKKEVVEAGFGSDPVVIVEFVKDSQTLCFPLHIMDAAFTFAQKADPFVHVSALTGAKIKRPMSLGSCIESINYHIRSDAHNQLLLRTSKMKQSDVQRIRDIATDSKREAVQILREKMDRELIYKRRSVYC